jgi:hypothetical protein
MGVNIQSEILARFLEEGLFLRAGRGQIKVTKRSQKTEKGWE